MYLSKIEVIGFKSFAQRINVNFDSGVTAIVGPNGCGKTNIVDAIRWALGEQRYSTLRSDKMEDVIFNGTKSRKPLGLAEVSLSIENTKGILPTEYSEVTITRRVFRSGESEYLLNKVPCRLKDILDLFMDTGMGSDAYSVIELKMVESILSDKTDERRKLFEEAAGVTKYKHRRKAAYRKLEDVQKDLERVNDIVKEVQKTVGSLERQAKKAEQYNDVSTRLRALEIDLQEREYAYNHAKLRPLEEKFALAQTDKSVIDDLLRKQEEQIDTLRTGLHTIEQELSEAQRTAAKQFELIHRAEEKMLVANERLNSLSANIERYGHEKADLHAQSESLVQEKTLTLSRKTELESEHKSSEAEYHALRETHQETTKALEAKKIDVHTLRDSLLTLAHTVIEKRGEQERLKARIDNLQGRIDRAHEDTTLYQSDIQRNQETITSLTAEDRELRRKFIAAEMELQEREQAKKELAGECDRLRQHVLEKQNDAERWNAKIEFLKRMIDDNEGHSEGVKYLLGNEQWKSKRLTTVGDIISAPDRYRGAVEAALAEIGSCVVVESLEDGYAAIAELKKQEKGNAMFICLQGIPKIVRRGKHKGLPFAWAADLIKCNDEYRALINFLFDDVVVVNTFDDAKNVLTVLAGVRCVTADGQIVTTSGVVKGGSPRHDVGGLIGKKEQLRDLEQEKKRALDARAETDTRYKEKLKEHDALELKPFIEKVKSVEKEMAAIEMRIAQLEFEKRRANDGVERNSGETNLLRQEIGKHQTEFEQARVELEQIEVQKTEQDASAAIAVKELESLDLLWNEKTKSLNELEIRVVTQQEGLRTIERDLERADARMNDIRITLVRRDEEIARAQEEIARCTSESAAQSEDLVGLRTEYDAIETRKRDVEQNYSARRNELHTIELRIKDERRMHDDALSVAHDLEMKIAELKSNIEHIRLRAKEEFDIDLELKSYPEDEFVDFAHLREEVKNLKDRIRVLGAINFAAFDEFTTESERLTFLTQQRDDLIEAEKTLLSTIEEINTTAQLKFSGTFAKIRENFITIFKELFMEGDECDLRIEEGVDPLEANIEIIAKPRGKRPTSIDLLSGGEKTLTAIALLFAIYLVKPSPFCILDEVDAPLDDSNIDRYTRILKKFSSNTQFIVVTHNKRTMEAAHALYGITMEEEGVSKVVTVRFNEEARVRSATVTN